MRFPKQQKYFFIQFNLRTPENYYIFFLLKIKWIILVTAGNDKQMIFAISFIFFLLCDIGK